MFAVLIQVSAPAGCTCSGCQLPNPEVSQNWPWIFTYKNKQNIYLKNVIKTEIFKSMLAESICGEDIGLTKQ